MKIPSRMFHRVFAAAVLLTGILSTPALSMTVGETFGMDNPVPADPDGSLDGLAVATNGSDYLLVWSDDRSAVYGDSIFAARLTADGDLLDPNDIFVAREQSVMPVVAGDGENFLIVWAYKESYEDKTDLYGIRMAPDGNLLDDEPFVICGAPERQYPLAIAFDGAQYLLVWADTRNDAVNQTYDLYGARIGTDGSVIDAGGFPISVGSASVTQAAVRFDGSRFLVAWRSYEPAAHTADVFATHVTTGGVVESPPIAVTDSGDAAGGPVLAMNGDLAWIGWTRNPSSYEYQNYGTRLSADGDVLDPGGIWFSGGLYISPQGQALAMGDGFWVNWVDWTDRYDEEPPYENRFYGSRIDADGVNLDPGGVLLSTSVANSPLVETNGSNILAAWMNWPVYEAMRFDMTPSPLDAQAVPFVRSANSQTFPRVVYNGENWLVVWEDDRTGTTTDVYGVRVAPDATVLDPQGLPIAAQDDWQDTPEAVSIGGTILATWRHREPYSANIARGVHIAGDGTLQEPGGFSFAGLPGDQDSTALAFDGENLLLVWEDHYDDPVGVFATRITPDGTVLDTPPLVLTQVVDPGNGWYQYLPDVVWCGGSYHVFWHENGGVLDTAQVYYRRVSADGELLGAGPERVCNAALATTAGARAACDGAGVLVVYHYQGTFEYGSDIRATRVSADGDILDPSGFAVTDAYSEQTWPDVAFDGRNYVVVWQDTRNGPGDFVDNSYEDIYAARVSPQGDVLDPNGVPVSTEHFSEHSPAIDCDGEGNCLAAYSSFDMGPDTNSVRIHGRFLVDATTTTTTTTTSTGASTTTVPGDDDTDDDTVDDDTVDDDTVDDDTVDDDTLDDDTVDDDDSVADDDDSASDDDAQSGGSGDDDSGGGLCG